MQVILIYEFKIKFRNLCLCVCVHVCSVYICHSTHIDVREQLCQVLPSIHGELNSGHQPSNQAPDSYFVEGLSMNHVASHGGACLKF